MDFKISGGWGKAWYSKLNKSSLEVPFCAFRYTDNAVRAPRSGRSGEDKIIHPHREPRPDYPVIHPVT
jgi:hypothetical protein